MDEVPGAERLLAIFHEEQTGPGEDEEVLLGGLGVEHARGLAGLEHGEREARVREHLRLGVGSLGEDARAALEDAATAERVVSQPRRVGDVDDEPAGRDRREPRADVLQVCFLDHCGSSLEMCREILTGEHVFV